MPLIRFTKLIDKVFNHEKTQTMRLPRKIPEKWKDKHDPIRIGDTLHVYVLMKVGTATVTDLKRKLLSDITEEEALLDGFDGPDALSKCKEALLQMHKLTSTDTVFEIITFDPDWPKQEILNNEQLAVVTESLSHYMTCSNYKDELFKDVENLFENLVLKGH